MTRLRALPYLQAFETTARLGSVTAAATALNLTAGAVSQQIHKLEKLLNVKLFLRAGRGLSITQEGASLSRHAVSMLSELETWTDNLSAIRREQKHFTISVPLTLAVSWLMPLMFDFAEAMGLRSWNMLAATDVRQVDWKRVDAAIVYGNPPWKGYSWRLVSKVELGPVCSPSLLNIGPPLRSPKDIMNHCLLHEDDGGEWRRWMTAAHVRRISNRNAYFSTLAMALTAALDGKGVALIGDLPTQDYLRSGRLMRPFSRRVEASKSYYCVCVEARSEDLLVQRFFEKVIEKAISVPDKAT